MSSDRMDICEAYYMYAYLYHQGQNSKAYRIFGRLKKIGWKPSSNLKLENLTKEGRVIFDSLVKKNY